MGLVAAVTDTLEPTVTEAIAPGIYPSLPDADYFGLPSLSHSDCKLILDRSPAVYRWVKDNAVTDHKPEFDFGHVVHEIVLGEGSGFDVHDFDAWTTKDAKAARAESYANGRAPIKRADYDTAKAAADAVRLHPRAAKLLDHGNYTELAMVWDDNGIMRRAKLDLITGPFGVDLKTAQDASTAGFGRSAGKFRYHSQDAFYRDALRACLDIADPQFLFVVVEKSPPHLVNVVQLDAYDVELGAKRNERAVDLYRQCVESDTWPGYGDGINECRLPAWAEMEEEQA